jgi:hypothetical protein
MSTAVAIMDRDSWRARTDVLVVADAHRCQLQWVPRDLWCDGLGNRINTAFRAGGHELLQQSLAEHGLSAGATLVLRRQAAETALEGASVTVPVETRLEFWYPLAPTQPIEDGRKRITFEPPRVRLEGERLHQWIGARYQVAGPAWDLSRIERQQTFVRALLQHRFAFERALTDPDLFRCSSDTAIDELSRVEADWSMLTLAGSAPARIDGMEVLVMRPTRSAAWWLRERIRRRLRRWAH